MSGTLWNSRQLQSEIVSKQWGSGADSDFCRSYCEVLPTHHLGVTLCAQRPALQQWLAEVHTPGVDVQAGVHVVQSVDHQVQTLCVKMLDSVSNRRFTLSPQES